MHSSGVVELLSLMACGMQSEELFPVALPLSHVLMDLFSCCHPSAF